MEEVQGGPPVGGGIGSQADPSVVTQSGGQPTLGDVIRAEGGLPVEAPVAPAVVPAVVSPSQPSVEELQARLAGMPSVEELSVLKHYAQVAYRAEQDRLRQPVAPVAPVVPVAGVQAHPVTGVVPFTEVDKSWLTTGADGKVEALPGAPADVLSRWHQHQQTLVQFTRNFAQDPEKYLNQMIEKRAAEVAAKTYEEQTSKQSVAQAAQQIMESNKGWVYQCGADGQPLRDMWGNPKLSPAGDLYVGFAEQLHSNGMTDPRMLDKVARQMLVGHLYERNQMKQQQQPASSPAAVPVVAQDLAAKTALLDRAAQQASLAPGNVASMPAPSMKPRNFMDVVREESARLGIKL